MQLDEFYKKYREFFGDEESDVFPLLVKILDAKDDLSVQVHPSDEYASEHEGKNELGKNECWYILSAGEGSEIIYGHNAKSREEYRRLIEEGKFTELMRRVKVHKGDFFDVPSGTVHAMVQE